MKKLEFKTSKGEFIMDIEIKYILAVITFIVFLFSSCHEDKRFQTDNLELRQLVKTTDTTKSEHGAFFLLAGGYSSSENVNNKIKMYALVNGSYKYLEYDVSDVRIKIDNTVKTPYLVISYRNDKKVSDERITGRPHWYSGRIVLVTNEYYLPEQLLPITIK